MSSDAFRLARNMVGTSGSSETQTGNRSSLLFFVACFAFLYLNLFILPAIPICQQGDGLTYISNAVRMLHGDVMYRDFFQFTPPGTESVYVVFMRLFGSRNSIPNVVLVLLGLGLVWLSTVVSRGFLKGASALLPGLLFLALGYRFWLEGTHHWFSTLAVMAAVAVIIDRRNRPRLLIAGALCGVALWFTQMRGLAAYLGFATFLLWEWDRKREGWSRLLEREAYLFVPFLFTVVALNGYFAFRAGLRTFLYCTVTFGARYYPAFSEANTIRVYFRDFPRDYAGHFHLFRGGAYLAVHLLVPLVYVLFVICTKRGLASRRDQPWSQLMLVNIIGVSLFLGVALAPNWMRLCTVSLPAFMVLVWLCDSLPAGSRYLMRLLWVGCLTLLVVESVARQAKWGGRLDAPGGSVAFVSRGEYEEQRWVLDHTHPSDFLFEAEFPHLYFTLGLRNPTPVPFLTPTDYTRPEQVAEVLEALERYRVRYVLWSHWLDVAGGPSSAGDHLGPLRSYIRGRYHRVITFADHEQVWERNVEALSGTESGASRNSGGVIGFGEALRVALAGADPWVCDPSPSDDGVIPPLVIARVPAKGRRTFTPCRFFRPVPGFTQEKSGGWPQDPTARAAGYILPPPIEGWGARGELRAMSRQMQVRSGQREEVRVLQSSPKLRRAEFDL